MQGISVIMPCEVDRLPLLEKTLEAYGSPIGVEFIVPTRTIITSIGYTSPYHRLVYMHLGKYFNPAKALNYGVRDATYDNILITCPEVMPDTGVLGALLDKPRGNYVCQVFDQLEDGSTGPSLVNSKYRSANPGMYFLAMFKKEDLLTINGWDEEFMKGYAWEDSDFGARFNRAGLEFEVLDEVQAIHQWHPREPAGTEGWRINEAQFNRNNREGVTYCVNGIKTQDS